MATGKVLHLVHEDRIAMITFSPDGKYLATATEDGTARIWEVVTGRELLRLVHEKWISTVAFNPDGKFLATVSDDNKVWLWLWHPRDLVMQSCGRLTRNLNWTEWRQYFEDEPYRRTCENLPVHPSVLEAARNATDAEKDLFPKEVLDTLQPR